MSINVSIDEKKYQAKEGMTILQICKENGIDIPTFCSDERIKPYTSCFMCIVQVEGRREKFIPACSTMAEDGMIITTRNKEIFQNRKMNLELLLSNHIGDCYPPCLLECPSNVNITGYISLISRKMYKEAVQLIREENPLPLVCGRICARPCEKVCRRNEIDQEVAINWLKRFATDYERNNGGPIKEKREKQTNKKIAIIGAGPSGLSAAYYLSLKGHSPVIFEKLPEAGGMLRYGIPPYRMPRNLLAEEINYVLSYGAELHCNKELGKDIFLDKLISEYDAVYLAVGAQNGSSSRTKNEDINGVYQGVNFLRDFNLGKEFDFSGKIVSIIGGGNTAIDCARTALRMNAKEVILAYRRTEKEMPADPVEIHDAKEEGVIIKELCAPVEFIGKDNNLQKILFNKMVLGEADSSGRRSPVKTEETFEIACEIAIAAIGQKVSDFGIEDIEKESWGTIKFNPKTYETSTNKVFAGGDAVWGPDIAIRAIADGKKAAKSIDEFLNDKVISEKTLDKELGFFIKKTDILSQEELKQYLNDNHQKIEKSKMPMTPAKSRIKTWDEVEKGLDLEKAIQETQRCLECGCQDVHECKLKKYAEEYNAEIKKFSGEVFLHQKDSSHPFLEHDASKCILCGSCVRICEEFQGISAVNYVFRGFNSLIATDYQQGFDASRCISCGQCISACPVGALIEKTPNVHQGPIPSVKSSSVCLHCGDNCQIEINHFNNKVIKISNANQDSALCLKGKYGFSFANSDFESPINQQEKYPLEKALQDIKDALINSKNPAFFVSPQNSNQDMEQIKNISKKLNIPVLSLLHYGNFDKYNLIKQIDNFDLIYNISEKQTIVYAGDINEKVNSVFQRKIYKLSKENKIYQICNNKNFFGKNAFVYSSLDNDLKEKLSEKELAICFNPLNTDYTLLKELITFGKEQKAKFIILYPFSNNYSWEKNFELIDFAKNYDTIINIGENQETISKLYPKAKLISFNFIKFAADNLQIPFYPLYIAGGNLINHENKEVNLSQIGKNNLSTLEKLKEILTAVPSFKEVEFVKKNQDEVLTIEDISQFDFYLNKEFSSLNLKNN